MPGWFIPMLKGGAKWGSILVGGGLAFNWIKDFLGFGDDVEAPTTEEEAQAFLEQHKEQLADLENNAEFQKAVQAQQQQQQQGPVRDPNSLQGQANQLIAEGSQVAGMRKRLGGQGLIPDRAHHDRMAQARDKIRLAGIADRNKSRDFDTAKIRWNNPRMAQHGLGNKLMPWNELDEGQKQRFSNWVKDPRTTLNKADFNKPDVANANAPAPAAPADPNAPADPADPAAPMVTPGATDVENTVTNTNIDLVPQDTSWSIDDRAFQDPAYLTRALEHIKNVPREQRKEYVQRIRDGLKIQQDKEIANSNSDMADAMDEGWYEKSINTILDPFQNEPLKRKTREVLDAESPKDVHQRNAEINSKFAQNEAWIKEAEKGGAIYAPLPPAGIPEPGDRTPLPGGNPGSYSQPDVDIPGVPNAPTSAPITGPSGPAPTPAPTSAPTSAPTPPANFSAPIVTPPASQTSAPATDSRGLETGPMGPKREPLTPEETFSAPEVDPTDLPSDSGFEDTRQAAMIAALRERGFTDDELRDRYGFSIPSQDSAPPPAPEATNLGRHMSNVDRPVPMATGATAGADAGTDYIEQLGTSSMTRDWAPEGIYAKDLSIPPEDSEPPAAEPKQGTFPGGKEIPWSGGLGGAMFGAVEGKRFGDTPNRPAPAPKERTLGNRLIDKVKNVGKNGSFDAPQVTEETSAEPELFPGLRKRMDEAMEKAENPDGGDWQETHRQKKIDQAAKEIEQEKQMLLDEEEADRFEKTGHIGPTGETGMAGPAGYTPPPSLPGSMSTSLPHEQYTHPGEQLPGMEGVDDLPELPELDTMAGVENPGKSKIFDQGPENLYREPEDYQYRSKTWSERAKEKEMDDAWANRNNAPYTLPEISPEMEEAWANRTAPDPFEGTDDLPELPELDTMAGVDYPGPDASVSFDEFVAQEQAQEQAQERAQEQQEMLNRSQADPWDQEIAPYRGLPQYEDETPEDYQARKDRNSELRHGMNQDLMDDKDQEWLDKENSRRRWTDGPYTEGQGRTREEDDLAKERNKGKGQEWLDRNKTPAVPAPDGPIAQTPAPQRPDFQKPAPQKPARKPWMSPKQKEEEYKRRILEEKKKRGFQHIGEGGPGGKGLQFVNPDRAHSFARKHGLPGRDLRGPKGQLNISRQQYGPGGTILGAEGDPFEKNVSLPLQSDQNFIARQTRGQEFNSKMNRGTVDVPKGTSNFDRPTTQRIGNVPNPKKRLRPQDILESQWSA